MTTTAVASIQLIPPDKGIAGDNEACSESMPGHQYTWGSHRRCAIHRRTADIKGH